MTTRTWVLALGCAIVMLAAGAAFLQRAETHLPPLIPAATANDVLRHVREGKRVIFVDAREPAEYREERMPGAINLTLREVQTMDARELGDPDLVIAYCIKDFRGYEVAKALDRAGVQNVHVLAEVGIQGWKKLGLPTEKGPIVREPGNSALLQQCAAAPETCLRGSGG